MYHCSGRNTNMFVEHVEIGGGHPFSISLLICMHFHLICMLGRHVTTNGTHITALNRAWLVIYADTEDEQTATFANTLFNANVLRVFSLCAFSQGLHTTGLQDSDSRQNQTRPGRHSNTHLLSAKRHPSVQLCPQIHVREEQTNHVADRRRQLHVFECKHNIQLWRQQQEVR